jgi:putative folate metabolism gamma-glutamate ligase
MNVIPIKTKIVTGEDRLEDILSLYLQPLQDKSIVAITSKIISICQGRVVSKSSCNKKDLISSEADYLLESDHNPYDISLTVKNGILIPSAGIDESNGDDVYILYPENIQQTAKDIWHHLKRINKIEHLGVIITDSHTTPMRRGVTGISLGWCGFKPIYSYIGKPDIYNTPLKVTQINILDALATSAVFMMGEGNEVTPIAVISDAPKIEFTKTTPTDEEVKSIAISMDDDLYAPILQSARWIPKNSNQA